METLRGRNRHPASCGIFPTEAGSSVRRPAGRKPWVVCCGTALLPAGTQARSPLLFPATSRHSSAVRRKALSQNSYRPPPRGQGTPVHLRNKLLSRRRKPPSNSRQLLVKLLRGAYLLGAGQAYRGTKVSLHFPRTHSLATQQITQKDGGRPAATPLSPALPHPGLERKEDPAGLREASEGQQLRPRAREGCARG